MKTSIEKEYKKLLSKMQYDVLVSHLQPLNTHYQKNTYYDTEDGQIRKLHGAMRIRECNQEFIFTLKLWKGTDLYEFERNVTKNHPDVFQDFEIQELLQSHGIHGNIVSLTTLETTRSEYHSEFATICLDHSKYNGLEDYEIEYEYKKEHDGLRVFNELLSHIHVTYEKNCDSKIKRALDSL